MRQEMFKSVIEAGHAAIKSIFLLNGGACIAVLSILSRSDINPVDLKKTLLMFGLGAACAALAAGGTYVAQMFFYNEFAAYKKKDEGKRKKFTKLGVGFQAANIIAWLAALGLFVAGCLEMYNSFQ